MFGLHDAHALELAEEIVYDDDHDLSPDDVQAKEVVKNADGAYDVYVTLKLCVETLELDDFPDPTAARKMAADTEHTYCVVCQGEVT